MAVCNNGKITMEKMRSWEAWRTPKWEKRAPSRNVCGTKYEAHQRIAEEYFREHGRDLPFDSPPADDRIRPAAIRLEEFSQYFRLAKEE